MQVQAPARWGVLVYSSASPDIEAACKASFEEVIHAAPFDGVAIGGWLGTAAGTRMVAPGRDEHADARDMSSPATLEAFLAWGMKAVPAEHYVVVLGGHGSGFMGCVTDVTRQKIMRPQEMREALAGAGLHADVLVLNACLEANVEVALEVAPQADFLVASQGLQKHEGIPLGRAVERLKADTKPIEAARVLVDASKSAPARTPLLSAVDEREVGDVADALDALGGALLVEPFALEVAREVVRDLPDFRELPHDRPLVDLKDVQALARRLADDPRLHGTAAASCAETLDRETREAVVATTPREGAEGLSVYVPTEPLHIERAQKQYDSLSLGERAPRWREAVRLLADV